MAGALHSDDIRFMRAAIRFARRHKGLTGTNPSVGTLLVKDGTVVGRGVTAIGGRPHAETQALAEAGGAARGATAYVTLEPCAHHGRTPPCAEALVAAGVARVVVAASDPDARVSGKGFAILRQAGIEVIPMVLAAESADDLAGYLCRSSLRRPEITLKLALSSDGFIGRDGEGQVAITGAIARAQTHILRAQSDIILVGIGTVLADDPLLDVRLSGLEQRSPIRLVLDSELRLPLQSRLLASLQQAPLWLAASPEAAARNGAMMRQLGCRVIATESHDGRIALPELVEDLAAQGISSVLVEGGAHVAAAFLQEGLVDRLILYRAPLEIGAATGIAIPGLQTHIENEFSLVHEAQFGADRATEYRRKS